jgi:biopolymer transport protein ExbD
MGGPFRHDYAAAPIADVNVVPLADVSLVLLIILLVLSPMAAQSMLRVQNAAAKDDAKRPTGEDLLPKTAEAALVVSLTEAGYEAGGRTFATAPELCSWLQGETARRDDRKAFVEPSLETPHGRVVSAVELIQGCGASGVALVQIADTEAAP